MLGPACDKLPVCDDSGQCKLVSFVDSSGTEIMTDPVLAVGASGCGNYGVFRLQRSGLVDAWCAAVDGDLLISCGLSDTRMVDGGEVR